LRPFAGSAAATALAVSVRDTTDVEALQILHSGVIRAAAGSAATPSYSSLAQASTGMYMAVNNIFFSIAGTQMARFENAVGLRMSTGFIHNTDGLEATPSYCFAGDPDTGVYRAGSGTIGFVSNAVEIMRMVGSSLRFGLLTTDNVVTTTDGVGASISNIGNIQVSRDNSSLSLNRWSGTVDAAVAIFRRNQTQVGSISCSSTATAYNLSSDYRLKWEAEFSEDYDPLQELLDIASEMEMFIWRAEPELGLHLGAMAHKLQKVAPYMVSGEKDAMDEETGLPAYQGIDWSKAMPRSLKATEALIRKMQNLEARLEALEAE
jgi:hypothetical protein